jgi:hypothetical protein
MGRFIIVEMTMTNESEIIKILWELWRLMLTATGNGKVVWSEGMSCKCSRTMRKQDSENQNIGDKLLIF